MTNIDEIMSRLSKDTRTKFRFGRDISNDYIPTASFGINNVVGGFSIGKQTTLWGPESSGKSALALQSAGIAQAQGRGVGYIDAEKTFSAVWARRLGVNIDEILVSQVSSIGEYADIASEWIRAGVEMIIVDSTSALMPGSFYAKDGEMKSFENTGQIGQFARELGQSSRMIQGNNFSAALVLISQVRLDLGGFRPVMKASGGKESEHTDSLRIRFSSTKNSDNLIKGIVNGMEEVIGRLVSWDISKNKVNGRVDTSSFELYTRGDRVGIDRISEILEYAKRYGIVEGGSWTHIYGEKFHGSAKAMTYLREHPEIVEKLEEEIHAKCV